MSKSIIQKFTTIPVYVGGMIPNETRVFLRNNEGNIIINDLCDQNGEFHFRLSRKYIGKMMTYRVRQSGFKYTREISVKVQRWGLCEAVIMLDDNGDINQQSESAILFRDYDYAFRKYLNAHWKSQYIVRNQTTRGLWFVFAIILTSLGLIASNVGMPNWAIYVVIGATWVIRAGLSNKALGLSDKPIY